MKFKFCSLALAPCSLLFLSLEAQKIKYPEARGQCPELTSFLGDDYFLSGKDNYFIRYKEKGDANVAIVRCLRPSTKGTDQADLDARAAWKAQIAHQDRVGKFVCRENAQGERTWEEKLKMTISCPDNTIPGSWDTFYTPVCPEGTEWNTLLVECSCGNGGVLYQEQCVLCAENEVFSQSLGKCEAQESPNPATKPDEVEEEVEKPAEDPPTCQAGFQLEGDICTDIDECQKGTYSCQIDQICDNTEGSYNCVSCGENMFNLQNLCVCQSGFESNSDNSACTDIDECQTGLENCDADHYCVNHPGWFTCHGCGLNESPNESGGCSCNDGFTQLLEYSENGEAHDSQEGCVDIDECANQVNPCGQGNACTNSIGSYTCTTCYQIMPVEVSFE